MILISAIAALALGSTFSTYRQRFDYIRELAAHRDPREAPLGDALRQFSKAQDVVLGSEWIGVQVIGPAGRKAVAVGALWSNPFVSYRARHRDLEAMFSALKTDDEPLFRALAARYGVTRVAGIGDECRELGGPPLMLITATGGACLYLVVPPVP